MSMDQIPQEIVDRISSHLSQADLKNTLFVSRAFRFPAEKYSRVFDYFTLRNDNREKFVNIYSGHRLRFLREVEVFTEVLPTKDLEVRDDADELYEIDKSYTRQIQSIFTTLKKVEEQAGRQNRPGRIRLEIYGPSRATQLRSEFGVHDYPCWRVHLLEPESLPLLESIRSLEMINNGCNRKVTAHHGYLPLKLDYRILVDIAARCPNLKYFGCRMGGNEWSPTFQQEASAHFTKEWAGPRRDTRLDFAKALLSARLPNSLREVRLDFLHDIGEATDIDHYTPQPDMVSPAVNDIFSSSLQNLSQHLRRLNLRVVADETLFWPKNNSIPSWPNLESLTVMFHMVSPSGQWYFNGPNGEGRHIGSYEITDACYPPLGKNDYDRLMDDQLMMEGDRRQTTDEGRRFRIVPNDDTIRPFLLAFAKAVSNMVALKDAALYCPLAWDDCNDEYDSDNSTVPSPIRRNSWIQEYGPDKWYEPDKLAWGMFYLAPGERDWSMERSGVLSTVPQLWWRIAKWRPDRELHELFQQVGRNQWGGHFGRILGRRTSWRQIGTSGSF